MQENPLLRLHHALMWVRFCCCCCLWCFLYVCLHFRYIFFCFFSASIAGNTKKIETNHNCESDAKKTLMRERERERDRQRDRQTDRQTDRERDRQRQTDRQSQPTSQIRVITGVTVPRTKVQGQSEVRTPECRSGDGHWTTWPPSPHCSPGAV